MLEVLRYDVIQKHRHAETPVNDGSTILPLTPLVQLEHLLKVTGAVTEDASRTWAEIWAELKHCTTPEGTISLKAENGFVPSCGWPKFMEKFQLLKHYLDSIQRICDKKH